MPRCKAPEDLRSEAYVSVRRKTKDEGNAADGRFSAASKSKKERRQLWEQIVKKT